VHLVGLGAVLAELLRTLGQRGEEALREIGGDEGLGVHHARAGGALRGDRERGGDPGLLDRGGEGGGRGRRVDRAVGQRRLLVGGGEVGDLHVVQGQPALLEHRREEVAAGRAGPAGDADGATLEIRDGGDGAVLEQVLAHLEGGGRVLRIARGDAHG